MCLVRDRWGLLRDRFRRKVKAAFGRLLLPGVFGLEMESEGALVLMWRGSTVILEWQR